MKPVLCLSRPVVECRLGKTGRSKARGDIWSHFEDFARPLALHSMVVGVVTCEYRIRSNKVNNISEWACVGEPAPVCKRRDRIFQTQEDRDWNR